MLQQYKPLYKNNDYVNSLTLGDLNKNLDRHFSN